MLSINNPDYYSELSSLLCLILSTKSRHISPVLQWPFVDIFHSPPKSQTFARYSTQPKWGSSRGQADNVYTLEDAAWKRQEKSQWGKLLQIVCDLFKDNSMNTPLDNIQCYFSYLDKLLPCTCNSAKFYTLEKANLGWQDNTPCQRCLILKRKFSFLHFNDIDLILFCLIFKLLC